MPEKSESAPKNFEKFSCYKNWRFLLHRETFSDEGGVKASKGEGVKIPRGGGPRKMG